MEISGSPGRGEQDRARLGRPYLLKRYDVRIELRQALADGP
jgi:hypothetical protein